MEQSGATLRTRASAYEKQLSKSNSESEPRRSMVGSTHRAASAFNYSLMDGMSFQQTSSSFRSANIHMYLGKQSNGHSTIKETDVV